jgi:hypothetical protein
MGSCNIYHKCQASCDSPVLCKMVDSPVFSRLILSSRYMWFNIVGENYFEWFTGRETYIESIPPTVYIYCFPEERTLSAQQVLAKVAQENLNFGTERACSIFLFVRA